MASRAAAKAARAGGVPRPLVVVLTGGPCGGKSSSLAAIMDKFTAEGFDVYAAPEVPTILMNGGAVYPGLEGGERLTQFEIALMELQKQMEDSFVRVARSTGRPSLVILDRAMLDPAAYIPSAQMKTVMDSRGWTTEQLLGRYDMVVHLITAADGAAKFYTTANNTARTETPEQAIELDRRVRACYTSHKRHVVVGNESDFKTKLRVVTDAIACMIADEDVAAADEERA